MLNEDFTAMHCRRHYTVVMRRWCRCWSMQEPMSMLKEEVSELARFPLQKVDEFLAELAKISWAQVLIALFGVSLGSRNIGIVRYRVALVYSG